MAKRQLWKTTIVVWSEYNPSLMETSDLVRDGEVGESWIECSDSELVDIDEDFPNMEFFFPEHEEEE